MAQRERQKKIDAPVTFDAFDLAGVALPQTDPVIVEAIISREKNID